MSDLSRDARDLIAQAKKDGPTLLGPSARERARLREQLTPLWAAEAPPPHARRGWLRRLGSVVMIAGVGTLGWTALHAATPQAAPPLYVAAPSEPTGSAALAARNEPAARAETGVTALGQQESARLTPPAASNSSFERGRNADVSPRSRSAVRAASKDVAPPSAAPAPLVSSSVEAEPRRDRTPRSATNSSFATQATSQADDRTQSTAAGGAASQIASHSGLAKRRDPPPLSAAGAALAERASSEAREDRAQPHSSAAAATAAQAASHSEADHQRERVPLAAAASAAARSGAVRGDVRPTPPSIDGELELLSAAQAALQQQRPSRALVLLQEHAFRFPSGALSEERMAMQALALCASGRKQAAQSVLSNLEARGSASQLLPRVRSQCGL